MSGRFVGFILAALLATGASVGAQQSAQDKRTIEDIQQAVLRLPYYGVFDFLAIRYENGTATLSGFVYQPKLKRDIINATKRVARVDDVVDQIEELPLSQFDDDIRWRAFIHIYGDSVLSRYAPGGGVSRFDLDNMRYPGAQPFGWYPIHIIVNRGHLTLVGTVDSKFDKTIAGLRAREVAGTFGVENALVIANGREAR